MGNSVVHIPTTMATNFTANNGILFIIASPSIFAAGSASSNIEAQDKDRTVNVGHHVGRFTIDINIRIPAASGVLEATIFKVERHDTTPTIGSHPIPTVAQMLASGSQQAVRLANPGKVFHFSATAFTSETTRTKKITLSPAKYRLSKVKAGDHWCLYLFNRSASSVNVDVQMRYNEYE